MLKRSLKIVNYGKKIPKNSDWSDFEIHRAFIKECRMYETVNNLINNDLKFNVENWYFPIKLAKIINFEPPQKKQKISQVNNKNNNININNNNNIIMYQDLDELKGFNGFISKY